MEEQERLPSFSNAIPINFGDVVSGAIDADGPNSEVWYRLDAVENGEIANAIDSSGVNLEANLYVDSGDGSEPVLLNSTQVSSGDPCCRSLAFLRAGPQRYYVQLRRTGGGPGAFTLITRFLPEEGPNDSEPNNSSSEGVNFFGNTETRGHLGYLLGNDFDEEDWYRIDSVGGFITVGVDGTGVNIGATLFKKTSLAANLQRLLQEM